LAGKNRGDANEGAPYSVGKNRSSQAPKRRTFLSGTPACRASWPVLPILACVQWRYGMMYRRWNRTPIEVRRGRRLMIVSFGIAGVLSAQALFAASHLRPQASIDPVAFVGRNNRRALRRIPFEVESVQNARKPSKPWPSATSGRPGLLRFVPAQCAALIAPYEWTATRYSPARASTAAGNTPHDRRARLRRRCAHRHCRRNSSR
jgi:hypothetical protein